MLWLVNLGQVRVKWNGSRRQARETFVSPRDWDADSPGQSGGHALIVISERR